MFSLFRQNLGDVFGFFDLLWMGSRSRPPGTRSDPRAGAERTEPERGPGGAAGRVPGAVRDPDRAAAAPRHSRNPVDRLTRGLPHAWRVTIDWVVTIVGAIAIVLAIKAWVVNPYRIPSSSMEPTLHCARPANGCEARFSDRVLANRFIYRFRDPKRGDIVVFETPPAARRVAAPAAPSSSG